MSDMDIRLAGTLTSANGKTPVARAKDIEMPDGTRLSDWKPDETNELPSVSDADNDKVLKVKNGAWSVEPDEVGSGGVTSWNDLPDKPFYEETSNPVLFEGEDLPFVEAEIAGIWGWVTAPSAFSLTVGETYRVVWDGTEHQFTAVAYESLGGVGIGNPGILGQGADTGEKFCIGCIGTDLYFFTTETTATHKVAIYHSTTTVKTLDAKFLPMDAIDARIDAYISEALGGDY